MKLTKSHIFLFYLINCETVMGMYSVQCSSTLAKKKEEIKISTKGESTTTNLNVCIHAVNSRTI